MELPGSLIFIGWSKEQNFRYWDTAVFALDAFQELVSSKMVVKPNTRSLMADGKPATLNPRSLLSLLFSPGCRIPASAFCLPHL